jgi:hypothetical protein
MFLTSCRVSRPPLKLICLAGMAALAGLLTPTSARAECGDYVNIGDKSMGHPEQPSAPLTPCHGPNCSRHDPAPPAPTAPPTTAPTDWLCPEFVAALAATSPKRFAGAPLAASAVGSRADIYHPPR